MCGIWALFGLPCSNAHLADFKNIQHRGPDAWRMEYDSRIKNGCLGFQRLAIIDNLQGMQPMKIHAYPHVMIICNGEIYNHLQVKEQYNFKYETKCDVECIIHLYVKFGFEKAVKLLDGVFAVCLVDMNTKKIYLGRDPYGVRPLFRCHDEIKGFLAVCSEAKGISKICHASGVAKKLSQFPPGTSEEYSYNDDGTVEFIKKDKFFSMRDDVKFWKLVPHSHDIKSVSDGIVSLFTESCRKRLMAERRIGCLLSGGLDSSLVAAIVLKLSKDLNLPYKIQTFSIGMIGSPDLAAAKIVADHIGSEHHEIIFTEESVGECIDQVIYHLESYDITTIRASVGMYLLCKYIKEKTNTTVIYSGEGADELAQGYIYFRDAPDNKAAHLESERLLSEIYLFDGLRTDRMTSSFSLEVRCPFLDIDFTRYYLSLKEDLRRPKNNVEKHLLRSAFDNTNLLPDSILWRPKEAFSDGVADKERSLFTVIQDIIDKRVTDDEFHDSSKKYKHCPPHTKESYYYRMSFEKSFHDCDHLIPHFWMPKWNKGVTDPSARYIKHYNSQ